MAVFEHIPSSGPVKLYTLKHQSLSAGELLDRLQEAHHKFFKSSKGAAIDKTVVAHTALCLDHISVEHYICFCICATVSFLTLMALTKAYS